jgi:DNA-binding NtrC family response regulator
MAEADVIESSALPMGLGMPKADTGSYLSVRVGSRSEDVERRLVLATLAQCGGTKDKAAAILGISLTTPYNRLREHKSAPGEARRKAPAGSPERHRLPVHGRCVVAAAWGAAMATRILLVDDHEILRQIFREFLDRPPEMEVTGEAASGEQTLERLSARGYDAWCSIGRYPT